MSTEKKEEELKQEPVKITILKPCHNKETKERYEAGDEVELDAERAEAAVAAGLAELATEGI